LIIAFLGDVSSIDEITLRKYCSLASKYTGGGVTIKLYDYFFNFGCIASSIFEEECIKRGYGTKFIQYDIDSLDYDKITLDNEIYRLESKVGKDWDRLNSTEKRIFVSISLLMKKYGTNKRAVFSFNKCNFYRALSHFSFSFFGGAFTDLSSYRTASLLKEVQHV